MRQNTRYRGMDVDYKTIYGIGLAPLDPPDPLDPDALDPRRLARANFTTDETVAAFTTDNQLQADFTTGGIKHTLLAGLDYQHNKFTQLGTAGPAGSIDMFNPVYGAPIPDDQEVFIDADTTLSQIGVYLQEQAKIADRWVVTLGGRYDWASTEVDDKRAGATEQDDREFTWKAGILYLAPNGLAPYFSYTESFFPQAGTDDDTGEPFKPETGQQYEVGIKYQPTSFKGLFTAAAFDITRQNYLTFDNDFSARQTGEIRSRGLEFEATAEVAEGVDLIAAYTWLPQFEITKSSAPEEVGKREPTVPEHMASLWLHYRFRYGPLTGFGFGGGVRYIGETFGDIANSNRLTVPDYTLFDAVVDYEEDGWRFAVNVANIEDETTLTCFDTCYFGAGQTIIASVRRRW